MSLYLNLKSRNYCHVILRMLPTQEILCVKDSDMKAMISPVSVGKIQSLLFHRRRKREGTGSTCSPRFCNKQDVLYIQYVHIFSYLICLGRVALQPKLFFKGPFQVPFLFSENAAWLQGQEQSFLPV